MQVAEGKVGVGSWLQRLLLLIGLPIPLTPPSAASRAPLWSLVPSARSALLRVLCGEPLPWFRSLCPLCLCGFAVGKRPQSGPVSRILSPPPRTGTTAGDHSSSPAVARGVQRPTRGLQPGQPRTPPYLVLLRVGFSLPVVSPRRRCALTAPFHPYHPRSPGSSAVCFLWHFP